MWYQSSLLQVRFGPLDHSGQLHHSESMERRGNLESCEGIFITAAACRCDPRITNSGQVGSQWPTNDRLTKKLKDPP